MARAKRARDPDWERKAWYILGATALGLGAWKGKGWYDKWKAKRDIKQHQQHVVAGVNLDQVAIEIYDAFYNYAYGTMEDEEAAISSLITVPIDSVQAVAVIYNQKYGKNLYTDFRKYLNNDQYNSIKYLMQ